MRLQGCTTPVQGSPRGVLALGPVMDRAGCGFTEDETSAIGEQNDDLGVIFVNKMNSVGALPCFEQLFCVEFIVPLR